MRRHVVGSAIALWALLATKLNRNFRPLSDVDSKAKRGLIVDGKNGWNSLTKFSSNRPKEKLTLIRFLNSPLARRDCKTRFFSMHVLLYFWKLKFFNIIITIYSLYIFLKINWKRFYSSSSPLSFSPFLV